VVRSNYPPFDLQVLYEDNHVIAVFKPAGLLTQGDRDSSTSLLEVTKQFLKKRDAKPGNVFLGLIHRLDRDVAGLVLFAKTSKGASRLSEQFRSREVRKIYRARVEGEAPLARRLEHYLSPEAVPRVLVSETPKGDFKASALTLRRLDADGKTSLVEIELETGRKHQIRAQLSEIGHPILGDKKYGARTAWSAGIALVAFRLEFNQPVTGAPIVLELTPALNPLGKS